VVTRKTFSKLLPIWKATEGMMLEESAALWCVLLGMQHAT
jgi:hypothetical protein